MSLPLLAERLTERRPALEAFLAQAAGAECAAIVELRPLAGGAIQENWLLSVDVIGGAEEGRRHYVLRADAPSKVAASLTRAQEFAVLKTVHAAGILAPEPLWLVEDDALLGQGFYLMRQRPGIAEGRRLVADGTLGSGRHALLRSLGAELAKVHRIRPPQEALSFLLQPEPTPALFAVAWARAALDRLVTDGYSRHRPGLEWGLTWCEAHAPPCTQVTLIHQDYRTGNYLVDTQGLTAILDWEFAGWGDPMSDVGWFCAKCWRFGRDEREAGGIGAREDFYRSYENTSGARIDRAAVFYWEVMAHIRWAVIALQQGARHLSGREPSLDLALTGRVHPPLLEREVLSMTPPEHWRAA